MTIYCVNTYTKIEVGSLELGSMLGADGEFHRVAVEILEKINIDEYLSFCKEMNCFNQVKRNINNPNLHFYRVKVLD